MKTLLLSIKDIEKLLSMEAVIDAVKDGFIAYNQGKVIQPDIVSLELPEYNGETDIKSCYNSDNNIISVKVASGFFDNGKNNDLPTMIGTILLYDGKTGAPLCIMDGSLITGIRTGAAGAISCKLLARKNSKIVAVFGSGGQARMQVYALCNMMDIEQVRVYSQFEEELPQYKKDIEEKTKAKVIIASTPEEALLDADIAISTTPCKDFIVKKELIKPGIHIVAVGADMEGKNEWDPEIFKGAKIVNDSISQCITRGETRNAIIKESIKKEDIYGEIGELLLNKKESRVSDEETTIFDTTGMAIQDNVTAARIFEIAINNKIGEYFEFI